VPQPPLFGRVHLAALAKILQHRVVHDPLAWPVFGALVLTLEEGSQGGLTVETLCARFRTTPLLMLEALKTLVYARAVVAAPDGRYHVHPYVLYVPHERAKRQRQVRRTRLRQHFAALAAETA